MRSEFTEPSPRAIRGSSFAPSTPVLQEDDWDGDELEFDPEDFSTEERAAIGSGGSFLFTLTGLGLVVAGGMLATASYHSWQVQQVAGQLAGFGIQSGMLIVGGFALLGAGRLGRTLAKLSARAPTSDPALVDAVGCMADNLSLLSGALVQMQEQVTHLGLREPIVNVSAPPPDGDLVMLYRDQKDAVFRLAASLDKLARTVTDQVAAEIGSLDRQFAGVVAEIQAARTSLESNLGRTLSSAAPTDTRTTRSRSNERLDLSDPEEIVLEAPALSETSADLSPLSFLEGLKEIAPRSQNPHSPNVETPPLDFDLLDAGHALDAPRAPLPATPQPRTRSTS